MVTHECFKALGDPVRQEIVRLLSEEPLNVSHLVAHFEVSRPAISRHLRVLRESGLVTESKLGRERLYFLESDGLAAAAEWLSDAASGPGAEEELPSRSADESSQVTSEWRQW